MATSIFILTNIVLMVYAVVPTYSTTCADEAMEFTRLGDDLYTVVWSLKGSFTNLTTNQCVRECSWMSDTCIALAVNGSRHCNLLGGLSNMSDTSWYAVGTKQWTIYYKRKATVTFPVFRISAESGQSITDAWLYGRGDLFETAFNLGSSLGSYYKNPLVSYWSYINITKVHIELFTDSARVVSLQFKPNTTSTSSSWFNYNSLITSPWSDINSTTVGLFQMVSSGALAPRTFLISSSTHTIDCPYDAGWLLAFDQADVCTWGQFSKYPMFLYALGGVVQKWTNAENVGYADDFIVFVDLQL